MKKLIFALLLGIVLSAQTTAPVFAPSYLFGGGGWENTNKWFGDVGYAKKTAMTNGSNNFPVYNYFEVRAYRYVFSKTSDKQATDFLTGLMFPFLARQYKGIDFKAGVGGGVGSTTTANNVGYVVGGKITFDVSKVGSRWGLLLSGDPSRSSVGGKLRATQVLFNLRYALGK